MGRRAACGITRSALTCAYTSILGTASGRGYSLTYDHQLGPCDERRFVDDVEYATGISVHRLAGNRLLPLIASFPEGDEPEPWPYVSRNWALLHNIAVDAGRTPTTVFAGEGGDELLLGQVFSVAARIAVATPPVAPANWRPSYNRPAPTTSSKVYLPAPTMVGALEWSERSGISRPG